MSDDLQALRVEIDAIDDQMIALLKARLDVVQKVGLWKAANGAAPCPIRAAREATLLKRIANTFEGTHVSPQAAAYVWRHIINASLMVEGHLDFSCDTFSKSYAETYFGTYLPHTVHLSALSVAEDVALGKRMLGIVAANSTEPWWNEVAKHEDIQVFAALPFIEGEVQAYTFAKLRAENSGDDVSLFVKDGELIKRDGFVTLDGATFIGAFAKPIF